MTSPQPGQCIVYGIGNALYLNLTNRCNLACVFCPRLNHFEVDGYYLKLGRESKFDDFVDAMTSELGDDPAPYQEIVFCGYGEPTLRLPLLKQLAQYIQGHYPSLKIRLNTNGLANLTYHRNILPELSPYITMISISLNAPDAATYAKLCPSIYGEKAFSAVKDFIKQAKDYIPDVTASVVGLPDLDETKCRDLVEKELGVTFRCRHYDDNPITPHTPPRAA